MYYNMYILIKMLQNAPRGTASGAITDDSADGGHAE